MRRADELVLKPIITEKSLKEASLGKYTFLVLKDANKYEIKNAVNKLFNVSVEMVSTSVVKGGKTRVTKSGRKQKSFSYKKARVVLKKGQKIDAFEEVSK